jgi:hypothetical protein
MSEEEAREFWDTHAITEEYLATMPPVPEDAFPPIKPRKYVALHLKRDFFQRIKQLARLRGLKVEELLEQLVEQGFADEAASQASASRRSG